MNVCDAVQQIMVVINNSAYFNLSNVNELYVHVYFSLFKIFKYQCIKGEILSFLSVKIF